MSLLAPAVHQPNCSGYSAAFAYSFNNHLGLKANFAGHNGSPTTTKLLPSTDTNGSADVEHQDLYTLTFGPMLSLPVGHFSLFTHFLVGVAHGHEGFITECLADSAGDKVFPRFVEQFAWQWLRLPNRRRR